MQYMCQEEEGLRVRPSEEATTGLGSSAALVTSLTAALLAHYLGGQREGQPLLDLATPGGRRVLHNLAQAAHCAAQGKIGSGFDVAAAVFGSQKYKRFNPNVLTPLMSEEGLNGSVFPVLGPRNAGWDHKVEPFQLPPGVRLMLADVDAGSDTPSLVGKVLKWHKEAGPEGVS